MGVPGTAPAIVSPSDGAQIGPWPRLSGTGGPGSELTIDDLTTGHAIGIASVAPDGTWSLRIAAPLSMGDHILVAGDHRGLSEPVIVTVIAAITHSADAAGSRLAR